MLEVHNFTYGVLTPGLGFAVSVIGSFLGLRCTARAQAYQGRSRARWLALGAISIGTAGVWVMHFIAMLGFTIPGMAIRYNVPVTVLSMLIAVAVIAAGLFIVGFGPNSTPRLVLAGVIAGIGVASMHYIGMAAMRMPAAMSYRWPLFGLSVVIAIVAATAALWFALRLHGLWATIGAALIMGVAVSGMHYTGMASMYLHAAAPNAQMATGGATAEGFLIPLILGISILAFALSVLIALSPSEDEIRAEAALSARIAQFSGGQGGSHRQR